MKLDIDRLTRELEPMPIAEPELMAVERPVLPPRISYLQDIVTSGRMEDETSCVLKSLEQFPPYQPEGENPNILIKGRWLERGGSAWWVSTAGTGKSIASMQLAMCMTMGKPFCGLEPNLVGGMKGLKFWIIQSEDSPSRITIDREDITAELKEQYPDIDWSDARRQVKFLTIAGKVGADFLNKLTEVLEFAEKEGSLPDVLIINPFLGVVGGPISDGSYVTPFLRGGIINFINTHGLQHLLERFNIAALIFHHTPKPPSEDDIDKWMKSTFPEYQGAGSSDITNWGRSFVTMMRVKGESGMVCITAGKNGGELGWSIVDGAPRHYLAWSHGRGITGKSRHAWREIDDEEYARVTHDATIKAADDVNRIVEALMERPMTANQLLQHMKDVGMKRNALRVAWNTVSANFGQYGLVCREAKRGRATCWFFGLSEAAKIAAWNYETGAQDD